jgi:hypothetical protein
MAVAADEVLAPSCALEIAFWCFVMALNNATTAKCDAA